MYMILDLSVLFGKHCLLEYILDTGKEKGSMPQAVDSTCLMFVSRVFLEIPINSCAWIFSRNINAILIK